MCSYVGDSCHGWSAAGSLYAGLVAENNIVSIACKISTTKCFRNVWLAVAI